MAAQKRIYAVTNGTEVCLVTAATRAQALAHVVRNRWTVKVASQDALVAALLDGVKVQEAAAYAVDYTMPETAA